MKISWALCLLLTVCLSHAADEKIEGSNSEYMMAYPLDQDDQIAEESAQQAVHVLAEPLVEPEAGKEAEDKKVVDNKTPQENENEEPGRVLIAELTSDEKTEKPQTPSRPLFKRPKIEELRKILGFPPADAAVVKPKPIPQEKPKVFQPHFSKPRPTPKVEQMPGGGLQINLRREDIPLPRPFGFPRGSGLMRPSFGLPDLMQAASSLLRRAIVDDNNDNDITSKDDKDDDADNDNDDLNNDDDNDDEEDDDPLVILPMPEPKDIEKNPQGSLFRRLPIPLPFALPQKPQIPVPPQAQRPRLPFPPLTPVAFFLPIAQQIMQNIRSNQAQSRSQSMMPMMPIHSPIIPVHHPMQQQQSHQILSRHQPQPLLPFNQQMLPIIPLPHAASVHMPVLIPHPLPAPVQRPMSHRRMPLHSAQPRMHHQLPPFQIPMASQHPILLMLPQQPFAMGHQQAPPVYQRPPMPQQLRRQPQHFPMLPRMVMPEDDRVVFVRHDEEPEEDQEVVILVPSDELEMAQHSQRAPQMLLPHQPIRGPMMPQPPSPLQRIRLLRELLAARQAQRQAIERRNNRIVEIVQQQMRIIPAVHPQMGPLPSELHPVFVPYPQ